jgi:hypothetical protein
MLIIIKRHQNHRAERSSWRYSTITLDKYSSLVFLRKSAEREEEDIKEDTIERRGEYHVSQREYLPPILLILPL